jgi:hypothetical protein
MTQCSPFRYFKTSPEIIRLAVMLYIRFTASARSCPRGDQARKRRDHLRPNPAVDLDVRIVARLPVQDIQRALEEIEAVPTPMLTPVSSSSPAFGLPT